MSKKNIKHIDSNIETERLARKYARLSRQRRQLIRIRSALNNSIVALKQTKKRYGEAVKKPQECEWKNVDSGHWNPSCGGEYNVAGVAWFKYCPYCKRKIKLIK